MTQPKNTIQEGRARFYIWPPIGAPASAGERQLKVPSVTTVIGGGIPKDALKFWAANSVARFAIDHKESWEALPDEAAYDLLRREPLRFTAKRAEEGSLVHWAIEDYLAGHPNPDRLEDEELRNQYLGCIKFLTDFQVEVLFAEATIYSRAHAYAGTADLIGYFTPPGTTEKILGIGDWKTGKAIYDEYAIQLTAYSRGDFIAQGFDAVDFPGEIREGFVIRPKRDGGYECRQYGLTDDLFLLFRAARVVHRRWGAFKESKGRVWEVAA